MTSLLLFIYLVDVIEGVKSFFGASAFMSICAAGVCWGVRGVSSHGEDYDPMNWAWVNVFVKRVLIFAPLVVLFSFLLPSKNGVLLMGGAVMADKALDSDTGKKVTYLLNQKLDQAIREAGDRR